jgi:hypothetical protein
VLADVLIGYIFGSLNNNQNITVLSFTLNPQIDLKNEYTKKIQKNNCVAKSLWRQL